MRARVNLWTYGATRGPDELAFFIEDASEVGFNENANAGGQIFFTLPHDHWAHEYITMRLTHCQLQRQEKIGAPWTTLRWGLIEWFDHTPDDVIYYATDYLGLIAGSLTGLHETHTDEGCGSIIQANFEAARDETDSRLKFVLNGTIDTTSATASVLEDYRGRLDLMSYMCSIVQNGTSARPIMSVDEDSPGVFKFNFDQSKGSRKQAVNLEYGGIVGSFRVLGYKDLASKLIGIASKTAGASVLYSEQDGISSSVYGHIARAGMYGTLTDQASLDAATLSDAKHAADPYRNVAVLIQSNALAPEEVIVGDSCPLTIKRGRLAIDHLWYTVWGKAWYGHGDGSEDLVISILPEEIGFGAAIPVTLDPPGSGGSGGEQQMPTPTPAPTTTVTTHRVVAGETLIGIARNWGTTAGLVKAATNAQVGKIAGVVAITNVNSIRAGQIVVKP